MTWQAYISSEFDSTNFSNPCDLKITDAPKAPSRSYICGISSKIEDNEEMSTAETTALSKMAYRALKSGGYFLSFLAFEAFQEYCEAFHKCGFSVMSCLYVIRYDEDCIPRRTLNEFPLKCMDYLIVCRKRGEHPLGFCLGLR